MSEHEIWLFFVMPCEGTRNLRAPTLQRIENNQVSLPHIFNLCRIPRSAHLHLPGGLWAVLS